jgi:hypothetical protein
MVAHAFNPSTWEAEAGGLLSSRPARNRETLSPKKNKTKKCFYIIKLNDIFYLQSREESRKQALAAKREKRKEKRKKKKEEQKRKQEDEENKPKENSEQPEGEDEENDEDGKKLTHELCIKLSSVSKHRRVNL